MNNATNKYTISLFVFSAILGAVSYGLTFILPASYFSPVLPLLFVFFLSSTAIVLFYLSKSNGTKYSSFINRFMISTLLKLIVYLGVLLAYVFTHKADSVPFIISFFILYVAYTAFEVLVLLKQSKELKK